MTSEVFQGIVSKKISFAPAFWKLDIVIPTAIPQNAGLEALLCGGLFDMYL